MISQYAIPSLEVMVKLFTTAALSLVLAVTESMAQTGQVQEPRALNLSEAFNRQVYPEALKQAAPEGEIIVDIWITREGRVRRFEVVKATNVQLKDFVISRMSVLRFQPARGESGVLIPSKVRLPLVFARTEPVVPPDSTTIPRNHNDNNR